MKQSPFFSFIIQLLAMSLILVAAIYMLRAGDNISLSFKAIGLIFVTLVAVTSISYYFGIQAVNKSPRSFTNGFMLSSFSRLFIYGAVIAIYCHWHQSVALQFAFVFFALYVIYTAFEIRSVLGYMKKK